MEWIRTEERPESEDVLCVVYVRDNYEFAFWDLEVRAWDSPDKGWIEDDEVIAHFELEPPKER